MDKNIQDKDYFSLNNLGTLSRIDEHLSFVEGIVEKYSEKNFTWKDVRQQIEFIRKKKNDKKLNISVIGEFSTGKSTFINALLRKELLASSALQGTTVASTVIDYDEQYKIRLEYLNGRSEMLKFTCFAELQSGLKHYTTDTSVAKQLKAVNVFLPADILKNEFRIIDTPGTNVTEAWHEDVTVRALREQSDLSIILTSAEKPVPNTMLSFVRKNLESILPQCVFVVTKLDTIRPRERDRQLAYVKMKLEEELNLQEAVVLPYVSPMVLGSEILVDDKLPAVKKKVCIIGTYGSGKRDLAEALLKARIPEIFRLFTPPILKFSYATELVVKIKLNEPIKLDSGFFRCCPSSLNYILKKYNGVNLPEIEVQYTDLCDLLKKLEKLAQDGEYLDVFSVVSIGLPWECLKNAYEITLCWFQEMHSDFVVRDEIRHAMDKASDIIMLLNATHLWGSDEREFIRHYYDWYNMKFIFAVDNMDKLAQEEVPRIKDYCREQVNKLATSDSPVCYISTDSKKTDISSLLDELTKNRSQDYSDLEQVIVDDALLGMSLETEQKLIQHTINQRTLAVTKKLTQLIEDTYQSVSGEMGQISKDYEQRLELLNRSQKADLSMFVRQEKLERMQCFDVAAKELSDKAEQSASANASAACITVLGNLDHYKDTTEALKEYINSSLSSDCKIQAENLMSQTDFYYGRIQIIFREEMKAFHGSFQQIYKSLDIIPLDLSHAKYNFPQKIAIETADIASTADYIAGQLNSENVAFWGKTAAGAAIGTAILSGIGTLVGGFIGLVAGAPSTASKVQICEGCKDKLKPQLTSYYNSISDKVISAVNRYIRKMRDCLSDEIDEYLNRYRSEVDRQIAMENNRRSAINQQINDLKTDMTNIQNHKKQLNSVMLQLNNFGRKE